MSSNYVPPASLAADEGKRISDRLDLINDTSYLEEKSPTPRRSLLRPRSLDKLSLCKDVVKSSAETDCSDKLSISPSTDFNPSRQTTRSGRVIKPPDRLNYE
nr:unnamed protein product [Callosobruchus analis]